MLRFLRCTALVSCLVACSSTNLDLGSNDAGVPYEASCAPGTYAGTYSCTGASIALVPMAANGPIAVTLVPSGGHTLALPSGATLSSEMEGTQSSSSLAGTLDCSTGKLSGAAGPVVVTSSTFNGTISGTGMFTATYVADGGLPALVDGVLDPPPVVGVSCTWSAQLSDAGPG